ncbi:MAG: N-acetyltransferase [Rhodobacteraceae bacterium]|nr:N-acetyltransferase [Paracoccaceae bacterium]
MQIRNARLTDAAAIAAIWAPIIRDTVITFNPVFRSAADIAAMIAARQEDGHAFLVAAEGHADCVGFGSYAQFRGGQGYARTMEHTINLAPAARGRGLGRALLHALEDHATRAGAHVMVAAIGSDNTASIRFHRQAGYIRIGTMPQVGWKFGRYHDLALMQKILAQG